MNPSTVCRIACGLLLAVGCGGGSSGSDLEVLAPAANAARGAPIDGVACEAIEQLAFHIHAHVAIFDHGDEKLLPRGIGISPDCITWLHTHDERGILHIESPTVRTYTMGNFFAVWGQPLSATRVGPAEGAVTAFIDGAVFAGDPATIPLADKQAIQLDVGEPVVAAQTYVWPGGF